MIVSGSEQQRSYTTCVVYKLGKSDSGLQFIGLKKVSLFVGLRIVKDLVEN